MNQNFLKMAKEFMEYEADDILYRLHQAACYDDLCFICESYSRWKLYYELFPGYKEQKQVIDTVMETRRRAIRAFDWVEDFSIDHLIYSAE